VPYRPFEPGSEELGFVQALAEQPFKEIDVRCPAYAEILSKLVDVGELVDFGSSVGRRGQGDFKCLIDRKKTLAQGDEWLPVGCDSRRDRQVGYQDVYLACNNTSIFRDARWFSNFDWRCKMFAWRECPWITATPVALLELTNHYLMFHCEWIGEKGVMRSDEGKTNKVRRGMGFGVLWNGCCSSFGAATCTKTSQYGYVRGHCAKGWTRQRHRCVSTNGPRPMGGACLPGEFAPLT
jgi:hypothetical protein